jgi:hypothetical protein
MQTNCAVVWVSTREVIMNSLNLDTETMDALTEAESAMFHVLADKGFNSAADHEAMKNALEKARAVMRRMA